MSLDYKLQSGLLEFVNSGADFAESVKRNIKHSKDGIAVIDQKTVLALNRFMIAFNNIADLPIILEHNTKKFN